MRLFGRHTAHFVNPIALLKGQHAMALPKASELTIERRWRIKIYDRRPDWRQSGIIPLSAKQRRRAIINKKTAFGVDADSTRLDSARLHSSHLPVPFLVRRPTSCQRAARSPQIEFRWRSRSHSHKDACRFTNTWVTDERSKAACDSWFYCFADGCCDTSSCGTCSGPKNSLAEPQHQQQQQFMENGKQHTSRSGSRFRSRCSVNELSLYCIVSIRWLEESWELDKNVMYTLSIRLAKNYNCSRKTGHCLQCGLLMKRLAR